MLRFITKALDFVLGKPAALPEVSDPLDPEPRKVEVEAHLEAEASDLEAEVKVEEDVKLPSPPKVPEMGLAPYRKQALMTTADGFTWEVKGNEPKHSEDEIDRLKRKTERRARRYFAGKEVRHRVTVKGKDSIEFSFFRRSGKPVKIKWTRPEQPST